MKSRINTNYEDNSEELRITAEKEFQTAVTQIADGGMTSDYEEEVYDLLAGYTDKDGVLHKTFTLRDMIGSDEEAVAKQDIKSNGAKVATTLLARCVTSIGTLTKKSVGSPKSWEDIIKSMYTGDRDIMLLTLRKRSIGDEIEVQHVCPNPECKAKLKTILNVDEIEILPYDGNKVIPFELPRGYKDKKGEVHKTGVLRRPNGYDGEILTPLARKNLAKAETVLLTRTLSFDDGTHVDDSVTAGLSIKDRNYLQELLNEHSFGLNMTVDVECDVCGEEFKGNLNQSNFI